MDKGTYVLLYLPVFHDGYVRFLNKHKDAEKFYVWGQSLIDTEAELRKDIRALSPEISASILTSFLGTEVLIAEQENLDQIAEAITIIMPDDEISHRLHERLVGIGSTAFIFETTFLRWDRKIATSIAKLENHDLMRDTEFSKLVWRAYSQAEQSSDWWRRVGALLIDDTGFIILENYNKHMPTEYSPYINGDARSLFSKGIRIDLSTAIHAEAALIADAAKEGISTDSLKLFVTTFPCPVCARLIARSGINEVFYIEGYSMLDGEEILKSAGVIITKIV